MFHKGSASVFKVFGCFALQLKETLNPKPLTLSPKPRTLSPKPWSPDERVTNRFGVRSFGLWVWAVGFRVAFRRLSWEFKKALGSRVFFFRIPMSLRLLIMIEGTFKNQRKALNP